jgi:hypothetical protein
VRLELPTEVVVDATGNLGPTTRVTSEAVTVEKASSSGNLTPAHLRPIKLPTKAAKVVVPIERITPVVDVATSLPKANPLQQRPAVSAQFESGEPVNRNLGYLALALALTVSGIWVVRRFKR